MLKIRQFIQDTNGATAIEYGLIAALVSVAIVGGVTSLGSGLNSTYETLRTEIRPKL